MTRGLAMIELPMLAIRMSTMLRVRETQDVHPILLDPYDDHASYDCERISSLHDLLAFI